MNHEEMLKKIREEVEEEKRNYKGPHCCLTLESGLSNCTYILNYNVKYREYGIKIGKSIRSLIMIYCFCCGKRLPDTLRIKWAEILKQEYGLQDPMGYDRKKIPQDFLTDEWWKKRNF